MKYIKLMMIVIAAASLMLPGFNDAYARGGGGGGHMGGGGGHEGGWSGGRGGGDFERGGGGRGGGEGRGGDWGDRGDHGDHGDHGDQNRRNNRNNNNNTTNNVNVYGGGWGGDDWGWGAADGALAGMAIGAAIGSAAQPSTVVVEAPSTTVIQQSYPAAPAYGTQVTTLPEGCTSQNVNGVMAYQHGSTWYRPYFGSNGVYYEVVAPPPAEGSVSVGQGQ